ncbi:COG1361 S-layer family protein [Candidatus Nanohalobium constans]|uniref:S-layer domain protein n=1 Tax=Candidatus Nanohalobium constans TaxID=2565781 RepID=A0A5Q0UEI0_9ARCH|nr:COG1361 S-layer family protein [Candidatus Nanohalobium constans]QGA79938.1 S-layer domain protein [Candidatus Nanohalobium constans]
MKQLALITTLLLFLSFTAAQTSSNIQIDLKKTEPVPLQTSEYADIWLEVTNEGTANADNIELTFEENYPFSVERGDKTNWTIGEIIPGEEYQLHLQTRVDRNALQGNNTLKFRVETGDMSYTKEVPVEVRSDRNVLSIEEVNFPDKAAPGTRQQMQLKLRNLADSQLKNIQTGLDLSGDIPMATSGASDKNLVSIEAGQTQTINYTLNIDESAENSVYKLPIDISFENEAGTEFEQSTTTGINVGGKPDLKVALDTEDSLTEGRKELNFRLVNKGHGSADFVSMELQETDNIEVIGSNDEYIGSMDSDDFQTASFQTHIEAETESINVDQLELPVTLEYNDQDGKQTSTQNIAAEFYTKEEAKKYGLTSSGSPLPLIIVAVLLIGGGIYYWRRKRKE